MKSIIDRLKGLLQFLNQALQHRASEQNDKPQKDSGSELLPQRQSVKKNKKAKEGKATNERNNLPPRAIPLSGRPLPLGLPSPRKKGEKKGKMPQRGNKTANSNKVEATNSKGIEDNTVQQQENTVQQESTDDRFGLGTFLLDDPTDQEIADALGLVQEVKQMLLEKNKKRKEKVKKQINEKEQNLKDTSQRVEELHDYLKTFTHKPQTHMICLVMYDIENNKARKRIADYLQAKGLQRIQYSVFLGQIDRRAFKQMHGALAEIQASFSATDSIILVPVGENEMRSMQLIGKEISWEMTLQRGYTLFI